jgi:lysophospholipase L1-like esterase
LRLLLRRLVGIFGPILVAAGLVVALEAGLRVAGFEVKITSGADPRANLVPLFRPGTGPDGTPVWHRTDATVAFRREKPANGLRVFVVGESSVFGFPFGANLAFSRFLGDRLAAAFPDRAVEVVNCGVPAIASWHVRRLVEEELVHYAPDVVVIYTGHNDWIVPAPTAASPVTEFLARSRLYQLASLVRVRWRRWRYGPLDDFRLQATKDPWGYARQRARGQLTLTRAEERDLIVRFGENLRATVRAARGAGARVVVATLTQNLRDFAPGASRHRPGVSPAARARWSALAAQAGSRMAIGDWTTALAALRRGRALDPRPASAEYLRAQCLDALGRHGVARAAYRRASDLDEIPLGARSSFNAVIRRVADETGAQLVDVAGALARAAPHGLVGGQFFVDHLHPSVAGHVAIARVLAGALGAPEDGYVWPDPDALLADDPEARRHAVVAMIVLDMVLGRYDDARERFDAAEPTLPGLGWVRGALDQAQHEDVVPMWTDPPAAPD